MTKASDNVFPKVIGAEGAAPATPAAGTSIAYVKADGLWYSKDDAGVETLMSGGAGGGSVATDAIWDAAGDLAVGTGANTAARLAIGANATVLTSNGTTASWATPAAAPTAATNFLTSSVSIVSANTFYDGPSLSLAAGTYILGGSVTVREGPSGTGSMYTAKLWDGTTVLATGSGRCEAATVEVSIALPSVLLSGLGSTTTYKISVASTGADRTLLDTATNNGVTDKASWLTALKIA